VPYRPWRSALAVGAWIPAWALLRHGIDRSILAALVLTFPLVGAYLGATCRRLLTR
jgi:hypothetical protein